MAFAKRFLQFDFLRVTAMVAIISIHTTDILFYSHPPYNLRWWYGTAIEAIVRAGLPIFFVLSGYLLLNGKDEPIGTFYRKRFMRVVIPLVVYSSLYLAFVVDTNGSVLMRIVHGVHMMINGPVYFHLWFVYTLLGLYLAAPFIKKMLQSLDNRMLFTLVGIALVLQAATDYFPILHTNLGINTFIFNDWALYFILGYVLARITSNKVIHMVYVLGILGYAYMLVANRWLPDVFRLNLYDHSPEMIFLTSAIFLFFQRRSFLARETSFTKVIVFVSKYSYSIYFAHAYVRDVLFHNRLLIDTRPYDFLYALPLTIFANLLLSLCIALVVDHLLVSPMTGGMDRLIAGLDGYKSSIYERIYLLFPGKANSATENL